MIEHEFFGGVEIPGGIPDNNHYKVGGIETIDYIEAKFGAVEYKGFLKGNVLKYLSRAGHKVNEKEDYKKALYYLTKLINEQN